MQKIMLAALLFALTMLGIQSVNSQSNPFNPDFSWCNTQGAIATRKANKWDCLLPGSSGQVVQSGGPGADISWLTIPGTGTVTSVGATVPSFMSVSGSPITIAGTLGFSFNSQATNLVLASPNGSSGVPSFRALAVNDIPTLTAAKLPNAGVMTGDVTTTFPAVTIGTNAIIASKIASNAVTTVKILDANVTTSKIADSNVTLAKIANITNGTLMGNFTGSAAAPNTYTPTSVLDTAFGATRGSVLYRGASAWLTLTPGATGEFLKTNGAGADPQWAAVPGAAGGTVTSVTCGSGLTGGTFTVTGTCALSNVTSAGQYPGTATNNSATSGNIGEEISATVLSGSAVNLPSAGTTVNVTSISLTAGDWDISGSCVFQPGTGPTYIACGVSPTSAVLSYEAPGFARIAMQPGAISPTVKSGLNVSPFRVSLSTTKTYYLVAEGGSGGTGNASGHLRARRMR